MYTDSIFTWLSQWCFLPSHSLGFPDISPVGSTGSISACISPTRKCWLVGDMGVSLNRDTPKSSILIGFSIINHPFWGTPIFGNIHMGRCNLIHSGKFTFWTQRHGGLVQMMFLWILGCLWDHFSELLLLVSGRVNTKHLYHSSLSRFLCYLYWIK